MKAPQTLLEAVTYFSDPEVAHKFVVELRWPNGVTCPREGCGSDKVQYISTRRLWRCKDCSRQFTAKVGTIFEESPIGFDKWLPAFWLLSSNKNGISSCELGKALGVTQKTAWFMLHRIRTAMQTTTARRLTGTVEADETYVGGKTRGYIPGKAPSGRKSRGPLPGKTVVMGMVERRGEARAMVVPNVKRATLLPMIQENVEPGTRMVTDALRSYSTLDQEFRHDVINHAEAFVRGDISTNGIENFWSGLKRTLGGTYISVRPKHLDRYVTEQIFRFGSRSEVDGTRFSQAVRQADGKRLTYRRQTKGV
ncbi:MAG TPA: IS1595 family transposase [Candidatus Dormibacteraeota bacterium]|nr:IS1595 family transposase [Candidatus Dormibacteraeota bacterium]